MDIMVYYMSLFVDCELFLAVLIRVLSTLGRASYLNHQLAHIVLGIVYGFDRTALCESLLVGLPTIDVLQKLLHALMFSNGLVD